MLRLDGTTGAIVQPLMRIADGAQIPIELEETPWGTLLVSSFGTSSVFEYDLTTGDFLGELVTPGLGGLDGAHGMLIIPAPATASLLLTVGLMACTRRRIG